MKITLDPGHGARGNQYPPQPSYYEGTQMWKLAQYLDAELRKYGVTVVTTRPNITDDPEPYSRGVTAARNGSDMILSLHSNAAADTGVRGTETFYSVKGGQYRGLAEKLASKVSEIMGHNSRGAKIRTIVGDPKNDYYGVIRGAANSGCLCVIIIEHGFHTNATDAAFLISDANLKKLAVAEAQVIASYFGLKPSASVPAPETALTPIMGKSTLSADRMTAFVLSKNVSPKLNCTIRELAAMYLSEGAAEGVRGDIAFCQAILETGWFRFGKDVRHEQNNYCGLGATGNGVRGEKFNTPQLGVRAHIQHLKAYASKDKLNNPCVDLRFKYVTRSCSAYVEWLGQQENPANAGKPRNTWIGWAAAKNYGQGILKVYAELTAHKVSVTPPQPTSWDAERKAAMKWAIEQKITDGTNPQEFATREQIAVMLYRFAQKGGR